MRLAGSRLGAVTPEAAELVIGVVGALKVVEAEGGAACPESAGVGGCGPAEAAGVSGRSTAGEGARGVHVSSEVDCCLQSWWLYLAFLRFGKFLERRAEVGREQLTSGSRSAG